MKDFGAKLTLVLTFLAAALLLMAACYAQPQPPTAEQELARMTHALRLSEAQCKAILPILEDRHHDVEVLMRNGAGRRVEESLIHAIFDETDGEIEGFLAEEQQAIFEAMKPPPATTTAPVESLAAQ